jgi:molybdopterin/thiamine biosynthesis adenylyltransferase
MGGLGCPVSLALARAGVGRLLLIDDDVVDEVNLHRQVLFSDDDIGKPKIEAAVVALSREAATGVTLEPYYDRCLPENARALLSGVDLVVEGADNYASKFLVCDAAHLCGKPVVQGAAVGWQATVLFSPPAGRPCYRCIFEDVPQGTTQNCDTLGVIGPLTGFAGALMAELSLRALCEAELPATLYSYDGKRDRLRNLQPRGRSSCPLCGSSPSIFELKEERYLAAHC